MIFNLNGIISVLNFKIIGGIIQPDVLKENTIWVNTDVEISGYIFKHSEPITIDGEPIEHGTVWIRLSNNGMHEINLLKKNAIYVYPVSCKQYIDGVWVDKDVKIYSDGTWSDLWSGQLFYNGNQYDAYTGGWSDNRSEIKNVELYSNQVNINETIKFSIGQGLDESGVYTSSADVYTVNTIDVTNYSKLYFEIGESGRMGTEEYGSLQLGLATLSVNYEQKQLTFIHSQTLKYAESTLEDNVIVELDISSYSGDYIIGCASKLTSAEIVQIYLKA